MSEALKLIVDAFVSLKDRKSIEELREHRQKLRRNLQEKANGLFDPSSSIRMMEGDLNVIEAGLARLQSLTVEASSAKHPGPGAWTH